MRLRFITPMLALVTALAACDADSPFDTHSGGELDALLDHGAGGGGNERGGGGVALFDRLAGEIDGFGGLYRFAPCGVVLILTDGVDVERAVRITHAAVEPLVVRSCPDGIRVVPERGEYSWIELNRYLATARPILGIAGVGGMTIDVPQNGIIVFVASRDVADEVIDALERLGVPADIVHFRAWSRPHSR